MQTPRGLPSHVSPYCRYRARAGIGHMPEIVGDRMLQCELSSREDNQGTVRAHQILGRRLAEATAVMMNVKEESFHRISLADVNIHFRFQIVGLIKIRRSQIRACDRGAVSIRTRTCPDEVGSVGPQIFRLYGLYRLSTLRTLQTLQTFRLF